MTPLIPAVAGALMAAGLVAVWVGWRAAAIPDPAARPVRRRVRPVARGTVAPLAAGAAVGVLVWMVTGWILAVALVPLAVVGVPTLVRAPESAARITRLEAMEEWTRALAGVLTIGVGLEQALIATLRSAPAPINDEVHRLVARLRSRWVTEDALRAFATEVDDAVGDLIAANLILGARRRGAGLASVLQGLAESVAAEVRARRQVEADRAKPRSTARWVSVISLAVLVILALSGTYVAPYRSGFGQVLLVVLLAAYVATLAWMKRMAVGRPAPRFLTDSEPRRPVVVS